MTLPNDMSIKGLGDWAEGAGDPPANNQHINADTVDNRHYSDLQHDWQVDIANSSPNIDHLNNIGDVNAPSPNDGDSLVWEDSANAWVPVAVSGAPAVPYLSQTFGPGSHQVTIPAGVTEIRVTGSGAGGAAGGALGTRPNTSSSYDELTNGGGGGGAQYVEQDIVTVTPTAVLYISVPAAKYQSVTENTGGVNAASPGANGGSLILSGAGSYTLQGGYGGDYGEYSGDASRIPGAGAPGTPSSGLKVGGGAGGLGGGAYSTGGWGGSVRDGLSGASSPKSVGGPAGSATTYTYRLNVGQFSGGAGGGGSYGQGAGGSQTISNTAAPGDATTVPGQSAGYGGGGGAGSCSHTTVSAFSRYDLFHTENPSGPGFVTIEWGY